jgi:hypothetical protein
LFVAVYLPPQTDAGTKTALNELWKAISTQESVHPEAALLVAGDLNAGELKSILSHFYQHVRCATRDKNEKDYLDQLYSTHTETRIKVSLTLHLANLTIILSS